MKPNLQQLLQSAQQSLGQAPQANPSAQMPPMPPGMPQGQTPPAGGPPINLPPDLPMHPNPNGYSAHHHARFNASPFGLHLRHLIHGKPAHHQQHGKKK